MVNSKSSSFQVKEKQLFSHENINYSHLFIQGEGAVNTMATVATIKNSSTRNIKYALEYSISRKRPAGLFAKQFSKRNDLNPIFSFNAGYAHSPETTSKLGVLPSFAKSPLGLLIYDTHITSSPVFNHPALVINRKGEIDIKQVPMDRGIVVSCNSRSISIPPQNRNRSQGVLPDFCYYDADYTDEHVPGNGRSIIRLGGCTIKEIYHTQAGYHLPYITSGLTLSIADEAFPPMWDMRDKDLELEIVGMEDYLFACEAGPYIEYQESGPNVIAHPSWKALFYPDFTIPQSHLLMGFDKDGNTKVICIKDGEGKNKGLNFDQLHDLLPALGFTKAVYLDDGGGASLYAGIERIKFTKNDKDANFNPFSDDIQFGIASSAIVAY